jgi:hypothetical protein
MYALYSKAFAKDAVDLNKKDFKDQYTQKVTAKGKSSKGVSFEVNASNKASEGNYTDADVTVTVPVDDKFDVSLKTTGGNNTEVSASLKASDACTVKLTAANPDMGSKERPTETKVSGEVTYLDPAFSCEAKFCIFDGKSIAKVAEGASKFATGSHGLSAGICFDVPMVDGVTMGVQPSFGLDGSGMSFNMPWAIGSGNKDFALALTSGLFVTRSDTGKGIAPTSAGLKGMYKLSDAAKIAFEVEQTYYTFDKYDIFKSKVDKKDAFSFKVGGSYAVSKDTTLKGKVTLDGKKSPQLDLSLKQALEGKCSAVMAVTVTDSAPAVGFTYNLE